MIEHVIARVSPNQKEKALPESPEVKPTVETDLADSPDLQAELKAIYEEKWTSLREGMVFSEIATVAEQLKEISGEYSNEDLKKYAASLNAALEAFDQATLERLLAQFPRLIEGGN